MSYIRKITKRNKNGEIKVYYAEVESVRVGGKVIQRHIQSLGTKSVHIRRIRGIRVPSSLKTDIQLKTGSPNSTFPTP